MLQHLALATFPRKCETAGVQACAIVKQLKPVFVPANPENALLDTTATSRMILNARLDLHVQQKTLALEMGISDSYLRDLESGKRPWKLKLFNRAKAALERCKNQP